MKPLRDKIGMIGRRRLLAGGAALPALALMGAAAPQDRETKVIRLGSGPTGATEFLFGGLIANAISNPPGSRECERGGNCGVPGLITVAQTTGGAVENLRAVARGDIELGLSQADVASWLFDGSGPYAGQEPLSNLRAIGRLYPAAIHLVVRDTAKINGVTDLKGKRVGIGMNGTAQSVTPRMILSAFNVHANQVQLKPLAFTAMTDALAAGTIDALFVVSAAPVLALEDLARSTPIRIVPIAGPIADKIADVLPYYSVGIVPAGTYGAPDDVQTLEVGILLVARANLDDTLGFNIARALWHERNVALFQNGHPSGKTMAKEAAGSGYTLPLHQGAARYYLGQGISVPQQTMLAPVKPVRANSPNSRSS